MRNVPLAAAKEFFAFMMLSILSSQERCRIIPAAWHNP
jgi:hypothetical protein